MLPSTGASLGPYQLGSVIGAGGMGEVYRARDSRLGRDVAIKILPAEVAADPDRLRRFEQEARAAAALNHPNILSVHDVGTDNGVTYLVTELLEGQPLRQVLTSPGGSLSFDRALDHAAQIADGLAAAHARGIVHRDLKPDNLFVTSDGHVKILDFGLAKFTDTSGWIDGNSDKSPTQTARANTGSGVILGTVGYMAPEQVRGQAVDARTDIFAFGCVLYELLTGTRAFHGDTAMDTLSAILSRAPMPLAEARPGTVAPPALARIVERCLEKAPGARFQTATDLAFALRQIAPGSGTSVAPSTTGNVASGSSSRRRHLGTTLPWAVATIGVAAAVLAWWPAITGRGAHTSPVQRFVVPVEETMSATPAGYLFDISPDGTRLVYSAMNASGTPQLFVRDLDSDSSRPIAGTDGASGMGFSPDSESVLFAYHYGMPDLSFNKVRVTGGLPVRIAGIPGNQYGVHWATDQTIVYSAPRTAGAGLGTLWRVPAAGGTPAVAADPDPAKGERGFNAPSVLPDGSILFVIREAWSVRVAVLPRGRPPAKTLVEDAREPRFVAPGFLLFVQRSKLMAVPFDLRRLEVTGTAVPVLDGLRDARHAAYGAVSAYAPYRLSSTGTLAYLPGTPVALTQRVLLLVDRRGQNETQPPFQPDAYLAAQLARDGRTVALERETLTGERSRHSVWIGDVARGTLTPLTDDGGRARWTPDGAGVVFQTSTGALRLRAADLRGPERDLTQTESVGRIDIEGYPAWSPDGTSLVFATIRDHSAGADLWMVRGLNGSALPAGRVEVAPFLAKSGHQLMPVFSADGRYIAHADEGRLYVRPFPDPGPVALVSNQAGDRRPGESLEGGPIRWAGTELIFVVGREVMAATMTTTPSLSAGQPRRLFTLPEGTTLADASPDGQRFVLLKTVSAPAPQPPPREFRIVLNFVEEMKRKVAGGQ